jgi:hypothetical protein
VCLQESTAEDDIRCCTNLFSNGGKRWATLTTVEDYNGSYYEDTTSGDERNVFDNTRTGELTKVETRNTDCSLTTTWSGSVEADALWTRYFRDSPDDPFYITRTDRDQLSFSQTGTNTRSCTWSTIVKVDQSYTGGPINITTNSGNTCFTIPEGFPPYEPPKTTTETYSNEVANIPEPSYSNEYTTAELKENVLNVLPPFDNDWNDPPGSGANLASNEASIIISKSRYRIRFPVPKTRTGKCYRANWVERFIPEGGVGIGGASVVSRGLYRPGVTFSGGGGTGARAVAIMSSSGGVIGIRILNPGTGYTSPPTVNIQNSINGGTNSSSWSATILNGRVISASGGSQGNYLPEIFFVGGGGSGATATLTMDQEGGIFSVSIVSSGSGYTAEPTAIVILSKISNPVVADISVNIGTQSQKCKIWDGNTLGGKWFTRSISDSGHSLQSIEVLHGGSYKPFVFITGGGSSARGALAVVSGFTSDGRVTSIEVINGGEGYTSVPRISLPRRSSGSNINDATATATISGGVITGISVITEGNYLPTLTIIGGGGSGAAGTVSLSPSGAISSITLTNPGSGYKSNPNLLLSYYGTEEILLAAHFGTETEYSDGFEPPGSIPVGYVEGVPRTYPLLGDLGEFPWRYFELNVPVLDGNSVVANLRSFCDCINC